MSDAPGRAVRRVLVAHPSGELYGSDRVLRDTVLELTARGWDVTVTVPADGPLVGQLRADGARVELCPAPVLRKRALRPAGFLELVVEALRSIPPSVRLLRSARPDVVYVSTVTIPLWSLLARVLRRPVVCHVHEAESGVAAWVRWALAAPLLLAHRIVANSRFSRQVIADSIPRLGRRTEVVYNPVPGPPHLDPPRAVLEPPLRLLYVGRLSERKGPHVAVAAVAELVRRGRDVRLDVLGDVFTGYEDYERGLHDLVRRDGTGDRITFRGFEADVWPAIAAADVVLVPSLADEPFGNTAVEAVLGGRPVVASRSGGLTEAVDGYGSAVLVDRGDPSAVADAVEDLVDRWAEVAALAVADAATAADRHSRATYGERMDEVLSGV